MKRNIAVLVGLLFVVGFFVGLSYAAEKVVTLEFSSLPPAQDKLSLTLREFGKEMETKTNGRLKVNFHPGSALTPPQQTYDSVLKGVIDIGEATLGLTVGRFPLMEVMDLPSGIINSANMTKMVNEFYKKFKPKEFDGVKVLFFTMPGQQYFRTKKPVRKLEDLKGMKIRVAGGSIVNVVKALGAAPVVLPPADTYDALSKGVVDGALYPWMAVQLLNLYEILDYTTLNYSTSVAAAGFVVMNKSKWDSFSPDIQKIIDQLSEEYAVKMSTVWDEKDEESIKLATTKKHQIITLSKEEDERWHKQVTPVYDAYVKEKGAKGLPAAEALAWVREWVKKNQK